ncbi:MAG: hypothetical protein RBT63_06975, partial [Bdellovibrionales bacterium]|nr:hypothetical protein [Bdellovibrionales bacterium]
MKSVVSSDDLLFASLKMPAPNRVLMRSEIERVDDQHWVWDPFRATSMLPIMTYDGGTDHAAINRLPFAVVSSERNFAWTPFAPQSIRAYLERYVFSWMGMRSRVMLLRTPPGVSNSEHIDCERELMGTRQHKFRMVIQGRTDTLYFITKTGPLYLPQTERPFLIDGSWPHGMTNSTVKPKVTL